MMDSLPDQFNALVKGASSTIGAAFVDLLTKSPRCASVHGLHRHLPPRLDFANADSVARAARELAAGPRYHLVINAAGLLHTETFKPEKRLADLNYAQMQATFQAHTFGAAPLRATARRRPRHHGHVVGESGQHRRQPARRLVQLPRVEGRAQHAGQGGRHRSGAQPAQQRAGGAASGHGLLALSRPFRGEAIGRPAPDAAADMLGVLDKLARADSGSFRSYNGAELPW